MRPRDRVQRRDRYKVHLLYEPWRRARTAGLRPSEPEARLPKPSKLEAGFGLCDLCRERRTSLKSRLRGAASHAIGGTTDELSSRGGERSAGSLTHRTRGPSARSRGRRGPRRARCRLRQRANSPAVLIVMSTISPRRSSGPAARDELVARSCPPDRSSNQPAPAQCERREHVLTVVTPHFGRGGRLVVRCLLR